MVSRFPFRYSLSLRHAHWSCLVLILMCLVFLFPPEFKRSNLFRFRLLVCQFNLVFIFLRSRVDHLKNKWNGFEISFFLILYEKWNFLRNHFMRWFFFFPAESSNTSKCFFVFFPVPITEMLSQARRHAGTDNFSGCAA